MITIKEGGEGGMGEEITDREWLSNYKPNRDNQKGRRDHSDEKKGGGGDDKYCEIAQLCWTHS